MLRSWRCTRRLHAAVTRLPVTTASVPGRCSISRRFSTNLSDEEVNRDFYSFGQKVRRMAELKDNDQFPTYDEMVELELQFALENPLLSKYGVRKRDLLEGATQAIETTLLEMGSREILEFPSDVSAIPATKTKELLELVSETLCQDELYRLKCRKYLDMAYVLKKAQISDVTLTALKTEIVPHQRPLSYYAWKALDFIEVAVDNILKAPKRRILMALGKPSDDPALVHAMCPLMLDKDSVLYSYPPGSVAVWFEVHAQVFEVRQPVRWVRGGDNQYDYQQQGKLEETGEEERCHGEIRCEFYGCISGQVPLQWRVEHLRRRSADEGDDSDDE